VYENEFCAGIESVILITESGARLISKVPLEVFVCWLDLLGWFVDWDK